VSQTEAQNGPESSGGRRVRLRRRAESSSGNIVSLATTASITAEARGFETLIWPLSDTGDIPVISGADAVREMLRTGETYGVVGSSDILMAEPTRDEIAAKIEASEARTDSKFSQVMAELRVMSVRMEAISSDVSEVKSATSTIKWNIVATGLAIGGLIIAFFAFGTQIMELMTSIYTAGQGAIPQ